EITPPPPPKPKMPDVKIRQFTAPKITDQEVKPEEKPPELIDLETAKIGKINQDGIDDVGTAPPIQGQNRGIIETPKKQDQDDDRIMIIVQIESEYPGGLDAWKHFLGRNLRYPTAAQENEIE